MYSVACVRTVHWQNKVVPVWTEHKHKHTKTHPARHTSYLVCRQMCVCVQTSRAYERNEYARVHASSFATALHPGRREFHAFISYIWSSSTLRDGITHKHTIADTVRPVSQPAAIQPDAADDAAPCRAVCGCVCHAEICCRRYALYTHETQAQKTNAAAAARRRRHRRC